MMTQSVMTQAATLFGSKTGSVTPKGKQTGSGFDLMINNNLKNLQGTDGKNEVVTAKYPTSKKSDTSKTSKSDDADYNAEQKKSVIEDTRQSEAKTTTENVKASKQTNKIDKDASEETLQSVETKTDSEGEVTVDEQLLAEIAAMLQTVGQTVMETLNLSQEQFNQFLSDQGMSITDLLQPDNLQQFILASNGQTDISAVLTDEKLEAMMKDLMTAVDEIVTDANLGTSTNQLEAILKQVQTTNPVETKQEVIQQSEEAKVVHASEETLAKQPEAVNTGKETQQEPEDVKANTENETSTQTVRANESKESSTGTQQDTGREEQKDLKAPDQFQTFVDNLVKSSQETQVDFNGNMVRINEIRNIANQIVERIKVSTSINQTSMELQLNPENLGKVNLTVQSKNGVMTAQFVVQNEISKEAIESQLQTLRETLNSQGIKVEAIEVSVAAYAFDQNSQDSSQNQAEPEKNNSKQITLDEAISMSDLQEEADSIQDVSGVTGSQIDYTA